MVCGTRAGSGGYRGPPSTFLGYSRNRWRDTRGMPRRSARRNPRRARRGSHGSGSRPTSSARPRFAAGARTAGGRLTAGAGYAGETTEDQAPSAPGAPCKPRRGHGTGPGAALLPGTPGTASEAASEAAEHPSRWHPSNGRTLPAASSSSTRPASSCRRRRLPAIVSGEASSDRLPGHRRRRGHGVQRHAVDTSTQQRIVLGVERLPQSDASPLDSRSTLAQLQRVRAAGRQRHREAGRGRCHGRRRAGGRPATPEGAGGSALRCGLRHATMLPQSLLHVESSQVTRTNACRWT